MANVPPNWDATRAVAACPLTAWNGAVWRCHSRRYAGDNADGSLKTTGRYNRGLDKFAVDEVWPALYTGLAKHISLGERLRHTRPEALAQLGEQRISQLAVELQLVLFGCIAAECIDPEPLGLTREAICHPGDYRTTHALARAVRDLGAEAMLIPSCTRFRGGNLIIFVDRLRPGSAIHLVDSEDPDLFVDWSSMA